MDDEHQPTETDRRPDDDRRSTDPTRGKGAGTEEGVREDPTRGGGAGTEESLEQDPTRA